MSRTASIERITKETKIRLNLEIDGSGEAAICTSVPFLDHMLNLFSRHGLFNLEVEASGDTEAEGDVSVPLGLHAVTNMTSPELMTSALFRSFTFCSTHPLAQGSCEYLEFLRIL